MCLLFLIMISTSAFAFEIEVVDIQDNNIRAILDGIYDQSDLVFKIDGNEVNIEKMLPFGSGGSSFYLTSTQGSTLTVTQISTSAESSYDISELTIPDSYKLDETEITTQSSPDLEPILIEQSHPKDAFEGENIHLRATIVNKGSNTDINDKWYIVWYVNGKEIMKHEHSYSVTNGKTFDDVVWENSKAGDNEIKVIVESGTVHETQTTNNDLIKIINIKPSKFNAEILMTPEGSNKIIFVNPLYNGLRDDSVLITAVFGAPGIVRAKSNNPNNRFFQKFEFDEFVGGFKIDVLSEYDFSRFDTLALSFEKGSEKGRIVYKLNELKLQKIVKCKDSDNGIDYLRKGTITDTIRTEEDYCKGNSIIEYYCDNNFLIGSTEMDCPDKCKDGACVSVIELPAIEESQNMITNVNEPKCAGCLSNDKCLPYGIRIDNQYCDIDGNLKIKQSNQASCNNNFECESNLCVDDLCLEKGLFRKIMGWFYSIFS